MKIILKILFFPVTFPYYILKWLGGSSSSTTDTKGNKNVENKVLPTVTIESNKATEFQILVKHFLCKQLFRKQMTFDSVNVYNCHGKMLRNLNRQFGKEVVNELVNCLVVGCIDRDSENIWTTFEDVCIKGNSCET